MRVHFMNVLSLMLLILLLNQPAFGQRFSDDPAVFNRQATSYLNNMGTEAARKVAFDFNNAWNANFQQAHKEKIMQLATDMHRRGYAFRPYFWHFFSYLAYSVTQERIDAAMLHEVLDINTESLKTLNKEEYGEFLFGMNVFFARRYLYLTTNRSVQVPGGTYDFKVIGYVEPEEPEMIEVEELPEEEVPVTENTEYWGEETSEDDWGSDDSWDNNDDWGNDDSWDTGGDDWGNDDWGSDDSWDDSGDDWGSDDSWGNDDSWGSDDDFGADPWAAATQAAVEERQIIEPDYEDYVALQQYLYRHPVIDGPVIELKDIQLLMVTPFDSLSVRKVDGTHILKNSTFAGENGIMDWPAENERMRGAEITLGQFSSDVERSYFWSPNAKLSFPALLNKEVEGVFKYRSVRRPPRALSKYPIFTSNNNDAKLTFAGGKVVYTGGVEIRGNELFGTSISRKPGRLEILDGRGHTVIFRARKFEFREDSVITSDMASVTILLGTDSIYHPAVQMEYELKEQKLTLLREKKHNVTPFHSTYHALNINVDRMRWDLEADSMDMSIMNGKDLLPATFESDDFFSPVRYSRLTGQFGFHPIPVFVNYSRKYDITEFVVDEVAQAHKINPAFVKGAARLLQQYNFCTYDEENGLISLYDKMFHYYDASAKKKDYDNLFISSVQSRGPNASLNLDSMYITVQGVKRFYLTTDFGVRIEPEGEVVKLGQDRRISYDGSIDAGEFFYKGKDFEFDYGAFLINLPTIDSIRIQLPPEDSTKSYNPKYKQSLQNHVNHTTGTLFLENPTNRAGVGGRDAYPYFVSESEAVVYFDGPEILGGAYDKTVKFIMPPLEVDSLDRQDATSLEFPGTFNSGGIFPTFEDTLHIQPDKSLGFIHHIPEEGYNLYGTSARTYEKISLSNDGLRGGGKIDFLTSTIYSEDFIYYLDSVTAYCHSGFISPGPLGGASYPEADLGTFRMYWLPRKDSMFLRTIDEPFKFYDATAELDGEANITTKGMYGSGTLLTRGSKAISDDFFFEELSYSARHAEFEVLTDNPLKPAMKGDDIKIQFDLVRNIADVSPEIRGTAALSFPYAALNTSMPDALWYLEDSVITMEKPQNVALEDSYFYSTRKELDSLAFNASKAIYDINTQEMQVEGIPYIAVADAKVIPENHQMVVLANSEFETFKNAEVIFQNDSTYHYLSQGTIDILSRNSFTGGATYRLPVAKDTFDIGFRTFGSDYLEPPIKGGQPIKYTFAEGSIPVEDSMSISDGFLYKGDITLKAYKQSMELDGFVKAHLSSVSETQWMKFARTDAETDVQIDIKASSYQDGSPVVAGLHYGVGGRIYPTFTGQRRFPTDQDFFLAEGILSRGEGTKFIIEGSLKNEGRSYDGSTFVFDDATQEIIVEGPVNFIDDLTNDIDIKASVVGVGNGADASYDVDAFMVLDYKLNGALAEMMGSDLLDIVERLGNPPANDIEIETLLNMANLVGDAPARSYEEQSLKGYLPLYEVSELFRSTLVISGVRMRWNNEHGAWHNTTKLGVSNVELVDINGKMDGFIEIKKDDLGGDIVNLFLQVAPGWWYFFGYLDNSLAIFSSNPDFNAEIPEYATQMNGVEIVRADTNETLKFINEFRAKYFGITEPYDLVSPTDVSLEDEEIKTIEEETDEDDGFGF